MTELYIFNQDDQLLTIISEDSGLISAPYRIEINKVPETPFSFTVEADTEDAKYVLEENKVVFRDHEGDLRLFVIKELDDSDGMDGPLTTATCEPEFLELAEHIILDKRFSDKTARVALDAALEGTGWIGEVEVDLGLASTNFYRMRSVDAIWEIIKVWGGEFKDVVEFDEENNIVARKIKIIQRLGKDTGQRFEIDHNTTEIGRQVLSYPVTAMYGWGASLETEGGGNTRYIDFGDVEMSIANGDPFDKPKGQKWVGDPEAFASYRRIRDGVALHRFGQFSNQDYEDPEELLWATWDNLQNNNKPVVNYRLSVDLFDEQVNLGDTAIAIDRKFARPIEIQSRIIAMEYDLLDIDGSMVVEMGQFLELDDNRLEELEKEVEKIRDRTSQVTEGSFPDIKPGTPVNLETVGGIEVIQLYWEYVSNINLKHYEIYGSQVKDFVPDTQHLLWRGDTSSFAHNVGTDQVWYYRVRAVNHHGRPSDWSVQVMGATHRVISDDILFGPDIAAELRELSKTVELLADQSIYADMIRQDVYDQIQTDSRQYTDAEITATEVSLMSELANKAGFDYVDGKVYLINEELLSKVDNGVYQNKMLDIDSSLDGLSLRAQNVEANVNELSGEVGNALSQIAAVDIKANGISTSVNELRSDFNDLEIGGRNLIIGSAIPYTFPLTTATFLNRIFYRGLQRNTTYTFSAEIEVHEGNVTEVSVYPYLASGQNMTVIHAPVIDGKIVATFTTDDRYDYNLLVYNGRSGMTTGNSITISNYKLEKGNKPTDWTPAPEDIESRVSSAETLIDQTAYDLTFKASTQEVNSLTGRMISAESSLSLLSDEIDLKVNEDGIITALNLQDGTAKIQARLVDISDGTNLVDNGTFEDDEIQQANKVNGWINFNPDITTFTVYDQTSWANQTGSNKVLVLFASDQRNVDVAQEKYIKVKEGDEFYFEAEYRNHNLIGNGTFNIGFRSYDGKKNHVQWGTAVIASEKTYSWTKVSGSYKIPVGSGVQYVQVRLTFSNNGETTNRVFVDNIVVRRKNNSNLIVDGAITANLMAANSITAQNGALANASITRAKLQDAIIGSAQIENGAITNVKIGNAAIDDAKIGSLSASKINSGELNTDQVLIRGGSATEYTRLEGDLIYLRGRYTRTWKGSTSTSDVTTRLRNGHIRLRDEGKSQSLFFLPTGISTFMDGEGEYQDSPGSSGTIEWWDGTYSPSNANGITMSSYGGAVALRSDLSHVVLDSYQSARIESRNSVVYINPKTSKSGNNNFWFNLLDNTNDGFLMYGSLETSPNSGFRFSKAGNTISVVDGNYNRGGNTTFDVGTVRTNDIYKRESNTTVYWNGTSGGNTSIEESNNTLRASGIRANTGSSDIFLATNDGAVRVTDGRGYNNGNINYRPIGASNFAQLSSIKNKTNIIPLENIGLTVVNKLEVYEYDLIQNPDLGRQVGLISEYSDIVAMENGTAIDLYKLTSYNTKAIQELYSQSLSIIDEQEWLRIENDYLRQRVDNLEERVKILEAA